MKSLKKTLVLLVVFSMILATVAPVFAATDVQGLDCEEEVARLEALGVISGYEDGSFKPENTITRAEMAVMLCKMVGIDKVTVDESQYVPSKFSDVAVGEWYTGYINVAAGKGLLSGYPDGTFRPNDALTMNHVLTLCVNALGRGEYVSEMGTWPANYVAEAAKLGLVDGVKTSDANRGNVAMIVWNTLEAPAVWDVGETEFKGNILLNNSGRTLLGIYFSDYVYTDAKEVDYVKEAKELTVEAIPTTDKNLEDRQIALVDYGEDGGWSEFAAAFSKKSKDDTYLDTDYIVVDEDEEEYIPAVIATVPEEVWADLEDLLGKEVTVLFGEDEIVALIMVTNDGLVDGEFVEEYNKDDEEVTIAGETYEFANSAVVYVNNVEQEVTAEAAMENLVAELGEEFEEKFNKKVQADVILDDENEITKLYLYVSATVADFRTIEAIVIDVDDEEFEYAYLTEDTYVVETETYDYSDVKKDDLPDVKVDGVVASVEDIKVGNVVTIVYGEDIDDVRNITVVTNTVAGEVTRTKKVGNVLTIDGVSYPSSIISNLIVTADDIDEAEYKTAVAGSDVEKGDEVTLYVNAFGEIVVASTDSDNDGSDWTFAYVTDVKDKQIDENDDDEFVAPIRLLLFNGETSRNHTIVVDKDDTDMTIDEFEDSFAVAYKNKVIAFKANADKEIVLSDIETDETNADAKLADWKKAAEEDLVIISTKDISEVNNKVDNDFVINFLGKDNYDNDAGTDDTFAPVKDKYKKVNGEYNFITGESKIVDLTEEAVYTKWNSMIKNDMLVGKAAIVVEESEKDIKYIIFDSTATSRTDSIYALFKDADGNDVTLVAEEEMTFEHDDESLFDEIVEDSFVEYATNSQDEVDEIKMLIDVDKFEDDLDKNDPVNTAVFSGKETKLAVELDQTITVETSVIAGKYNEFEDKDGELLFDPDWSKTDAETDLAVYSIEGLFPANAIEGSEYTVVQENNALGMVYDAGGNITEDAGNWTKTKTYKIGTDADAGEEYSVLLADGEDVVVKVYEGNAVNEAKLIATYTIDNPVVDIVTEAKDVEEEVEMVATKKSSLKFDKINGYTIYFNKVDNISLEIDVDTDETTVYDLREGFKVSDYEDVKDSIGKTDYVIPFKTSECDGDADANILVIL